MHKKDYTIWLPPFMFYQIAVVCVHSMSLFQAKKKKKKFAQCIVSFPFPSHPFPFLETAILGFLF